MSDSNYNSDSGAIPDKVTDQFDPADEWDYLDPQHVERDDTHGLTNYRGIVDGSRAWVSDRGHVSNEEYYDRVRQLRNGEIPDRDRTLRRKPFTYNDDVTLVHHDHYAEHVTRCIVVLSPTNQIVLRSRSNVMWWGHLPDRGDVSDADRETLEAAVALSDGDSSFETPDSLSKVRGGWHSSMERSDQSDMINALTSGDVPPHWTDPNEEDPFPFIVRFGDTNNVCAVNASIYAPNDAHHLFDREFDGARAQPAYSGF